MVHPPTAAEIIKAKEDEDRKDNGSDGFGLEQEKEKNSNSNQFNAIHNNSNIMTVDVVESMLSY